jgi:Flp pilus assembly secretin CpaC
VAQGVLATGVPGGGAGPSGQANGTITVVNGMTVGGVRQVQLDVVIAQVNRSKLRNFGVNFTINGTTVFGGSLIGSLTTPGTSAGGSGSGGGGTT